MCGIFFSLAQDAPVYPQSETEQLLRCRGPDSVKTHSVCLPCRQQQHTDDENSSLHLTFMSTVLALRGDHVCAQPLVDASSSCALCWNGEAWKINGERVRGNDAEQVFEALLDAVKPHKNGADDTEEHYLARIGSAISSIAGPFAFLFFDAYRSRVFYGRDKLGRRSLLHGWDEKGTFKLCSICDGTSSTNFDEVAVDGVYMLDLAQSQSGSVKTTVLNAQTLRWDRQLDILEGSAYLKTGLPAMNKTLPPDGPLDVLTADSVTIQELEAKLLASVDLRVRDIPVPPSHSRPGDAKVAVLFSGGLDCSILARLASEVIPPGDTIDLLNVAFENPRVAAAAANAAKQKKSKDGVELQSNEPALSIYENCPDRITGRASFAELCRVCPRRKFHFVAINVPYAETLEHRQDVIRLMRPHNTEMDLSIACAFYFASRGQGFIALSDTETGVVVEVPYSTPARVLLSGLGADEVFAGYTRHGTAYRRQGFPGLISELELDVSRLGQRNLGRDDRVLTHWRREARYPFLDEDLLAWALALPVWEKTGFGWKVDTEADSETALDPEKQALRLLAWRLGMRNVAKEKKRAIQFGSRTAKMESGRSKGTQLLAS